MGILKKWWFWVIVVVVIGAISNSGNENSGDSASSSSSKSESKPDPVTENRPADEAAFIAAVQGQTAAKGAENDMQKGAAKANRDKAVCAALSSGMRVSNWTGTIADIDSNSEGKGVLSIKLANDIHIRLGITHSRISVAIPLWSQAATYSIKSQE